MVAGDVVLHQLELPDQGLEVLRLGRGAVRLVEIELVEKRVEGRERNAHVAAAQSGDRHPGLRVEERAIVGEPATEADESGPQAVAQPSSSPRGREQVEGARPPLGYEVHRIVGLEVGDHRVLEPGPRALTAASSSAHLTSFVLFPPRPVNALQDLVARAPRGLVLPALVNRGP